MTIDLLKMRPVLVADDVTETALRLKNILHQGGYNLVTAISQIKDFTVFFPFSLIIIDVVWPLSARPEYELSDYFGLSALKYLRSSHPEKKVVLMSRHLFDLEHLATIQTADAYFSSNAAPGEVLRTVEAIDAVGNQPALPDPRQPTLDEIARALVTLSSILREVKDSPNLIGVTGAELTKLNEHTHELQEALQLNKLDKKSWTTRLDTISGMLSNANNVSKIVESIMKLFS